MADEIHAATLAICAGHHLRAKTKAGRKAFMRVPDWASGFSDVHLADETEMLAAMENAGEAPLHAAARASGLALSQVRCPTIEEARGAYEIQQVVANSCLFCCGYAASRMHFDPADIIPANEVAAHQAGHVAEGVAQDAVPAHALGANADIAYYMILRKKNVRWRTNIAALISRAIAGPVLYVFTVSTNGVVRFHVPPEVSKSLIKRLAYAYVDSEPGCCSTIRNISHALANGCYCIGVFFTATESGAPTLMRFNRWTADFAPYWAASKVQSG